MYVLLSGEFPKIIPVPSHFFKVILAVRSKREDTDIHPVKLSIGCFLVPNEAVDDRVGESG